jgi:hypothetical protein
LFCAVSSTLGSRLRCSARDNRLVPNHNLLMKGELPNLFFAFAFLINGEKGAPLFSKDIGRHYSPHGCIRDSRRVKSRNVKSRNVKLVSQPVTRC